MLALPGIFIRQPFTEIAVPAKQSSLHHWKFKRRTPVRDLHVAFKLPYIYIIIQQNYAGNKQKSYKIMKM
jgi:hypothetical protein